MLQDLARPSLIAIGVAAAIGMLGCETSMDPQPASFVGVGVEITMEAAGARVVRVFPNGGAARAGVEDGDVFLEVAGEPTRGQSLAAVVGRLRGEPGTKVEVLSRTPRGNATLNMERRQLANPGAESLAGTE